MSYLELMAALIIKARFRKNSLLGFATDIIVLSVPKMVVKYILPLKNYGSHM